MTMICEIIALLDWMQQKWCTDCLGKHIMRKRTQPEK